MSTALLSSIPANSGDESDDEPFGGYQLDEIFKGDQPLNGLQRALAVEYLHRSEQIQIERLRCIGGGATLAQSLPIKIQQRTSGRQGRCAWCISVEFRSGVMSNSRLRVKFQYQRMGTTLRISTITGSQPRAFLRLAEFDSTGVASKAIRNRCELLFEGIIWAGIFHFGESNRKLVRDSGRPFSANLKLKGIDERLVDYWLSRFGEEIHRRVGSLGAKDNVTVYSPKAVLGPNATREWSQIPYNEQIGYLENYFIKLLGELTPELARCQDPNIDNPGINVFHTEVSKISPIPRRSEWQ